VGGDVILREYWSRFMATEGKSTRPSTRKNWETVWRYHIDADLGGWPLKRITALVGESDAC
jgi:hypothetical protein